MRRTLALALLAFLVIAVPFYTTAQPGGSDSRTRQSTSDPASPGSGRTYGEVNQPNSPGYDPDDAGDGFDFGWLGLLGLAGLLGLRHTNRSAAATR
jgi:MYXO-CTERM domain-containing protein